MSDTMLRNEKNEKNNKNEHAFEFEIPNIESMGVYIETEYGIEPYIEGVEGNQPYIVFDVRTGEEITKDRVRAMKVLNAISDLDENDELFIAGMNNVRYWLCAYDDHVIQLDAASLDEQLADIAVTKKTTMKELYEEIGQMLDVTDKTIQAKIRKNTFTVREARLLWHKLKSLYLEIGVDMNGINEYQQKIKGSAKINVAI